MSHLKFEKIDIRKFAKKIVFQHLGRNRNFECEPECGVNLYLANLYWSLNSRHLRKQMKRFSSAPVIAHILLQLTKYIVMGCTIIEYKIQEHT